jgi:hypothetical protein
LRTITLLILVAGLSAATFGQQSPSGPTTLTGCLISVNGQFTLQTSNGDRYILKGEHDTLLSYNGKQIQVTGKPATSKKAAAQHEFHVSSVKKIADFCQ